MRWSLPLALILRRTAVNRRWRYVLWGGLTWLLLCNSSQIFAENTPSRKKRDPFVALVNSNGKIKSEREIFPDLQRPLLINVSLTAIIWDEKKPLAMINGKIYSEGSFIGGMEGLTLEKIYPNSVILNENGNLATISLRKAIKNE